VVGGNKSRAPPPTPAALPGASLLRGRRLRRPERGPAAVWCLQFTPVGVTEPMPLQERLQGYPERASMSWEPDGPVLPVVVHFPLL
jgi:hypothetical protein